MTIKLYTCRKQGKNKIKIHRKYEQECTKEAQSSQRTNEKTGQIETNNQPMKIKNK